MNSDQNKNFRSLATYSSEILKIKKALFPDDQSVRASIVRQIEFIMDLIEHCRDHQDLQSKGYQFYRISDTISVLTICSASAVHSISYDGATKEVITPTYRSSTPGSDSMLMETYAILSELYLDLVKDVPEGVRIKSWKNK